jgi:hypothetical protein
MSSLRNISNHIIQNKIAYEIVFDIRKLYANFLVSFDSTVDDIEFEVDNTSVRQYLRDGGLRVRYPSNTHKIADCIAHANGQGYSLGDNVVEYKENFKKEFHGRVVKSLTRKKKK